MNALTFILALPPSANALFRNVPQGGRAKTSAYRSWIERADYEVVTAWRAAGRPTFAAPLSLRIELGLADRRRDAGNCLKPIEDALVRAIPGLPDDRWNDELVVLRASGGVPAGFARVTIGSLGEPQATAPAPPVRSVPAIELAAPG